MFSVDQWRHHGEEGSGPSWVTPFRGWHPNENLNIFVAEFTRTLEKGGEAASGDGSSSTTMTKKR